jgi:hypothetical protein
MLYGFRRGRTTIVAAATTVPEIDKFYADAAGRANDNLYVDEHVADFMEMMSDDDISKFKKPPYIFEHSDDAQAERFAAEFSIQIGSLNATLNAHTKMMDTLPPDTASGDDASDNRSIAEIHALDWHDPHDFRTDEQKKQDEKYRQIGAAAAARGELSGESFSPDQGPTDPNARITDVTVGFNPDGSFRIDSAFGVKGMDDEEAKQATDQHNRIKGRGERQSSEQVEIDGVTPPSVTVLDRVEPDHYCFAFGPPLDANGEETKTGTGIRLIAKEVLARVPRSISLDRDIIAMRDDRSRAEMASSLMGRGFEYSQSFQDFLDDPYLPNENAEIDPKGRIAKFFRVNVKGEKVQTVVGHLVTTGFDLTASHAVFRNNAEGCWIAFVREQNAQKVVDTIDLYGIKGEIQTVDKYGEPVVEKEAETEALPARPWNERALELATMSESARQANLKSYKGEEFIFCCDQQGPERGNIVYFCPKSYFDEHGEFFKGKLDIGHLLPNDLKEIDSGVFRSTGRPWQSLKDDLVKRGFRESWNLQIHLNSLD